MCGGYEALRPPNRVSVSQGIAQTLYIKRPGGAAGYWNPLETPYMVEPADMLGSRRHRAVCFVAPAQTGKALDVDTPIPTPNGWTRMGDLVAGDVVYDDCGRPCRVLAVHQVQVGRPCFAVRFDNGTKIVADDEHLWTVQINGRERTVPTQVLRWGLANFPESMQIIRAGAGPACGFARMIAIQSITPVPTRPVRCILVDSPSHLFLAGPGMVPTHNTVALVDGWLAHAIANDPGDFLVVQMTQDKAREYSKQRVQRMIRNSPRLAALRGPSSKDATIHDMLFRHGMWAKIAWPTVTNLSSTSYRYVAITDYDRIPDDIDGEGDAFTLGGKRTTTFLSRGMLSVESSPGRPVTDPNWKPATPHEAPPVEGILGIYNRGDRRRRYWQCLHCRSWFEPRPGIDIFGLPSTEELLADIRHLDIDTMARQYARIPCPTCGGLLMPEHKTAMDRDGVWLPDGVKIDEQGRRSGTPRSSDIASYWAGGAIATYIGWETLLRKHLQALLEFALTGNELPWQTTVNTDQGAPYMSRSLTEAASTGRPAERQEAEYQRFIAPAWTRFLVASVDVQGGINARFEVQVHAIGPYQEQVPIDRYSIKESMREGVGGKAPVDPAAQAEDWDVITERVLRSTYHIAGRTDELRVHLVVVDTGGEGTKKRKGQQAQQHEGVTEMAYAWWRRIKREGERRRVMLIKGRGGKFDWFVRPTMVGAKAGKGDVPLALLNTNLLKDAVDASARAATGPNAYHFPQWLTPAWFEEFSAEVRNPDGTWTQIRARNESFDLSAYVRAGCLHLGVDKWRDWENVPAWALPLDAGNSGLITPEDRRELRDNERVATTPAAAPLAPARPRGRRTASSTYL